MLYVSGQAGPRVSFLCRMLIITDSDLQIQSHKNEVQLQMKPHQPWRIALWLSRFQLTVFFFKKMWVFWLERVFPSLVIVFLISLTVFGLFCYCHFVIRQTMVSVLQANLISCRTGFVFSCFYKSNFLKMFSFVARTVQPQQPFFLLSFDLEHYN